MSLFLEILGWIGAFLVLGAYALLSARRIESSGYLYQGMNVLGALTLAAYTWSKGAAPSALLNVVWCAIGMGAIFSIWRGARRNQG